MDSTLPERGYAVNTNSGNLREDVLLLNIVRASKFEPMNFVALSKYTGSGNLEGSLQANRNDGLNYDILNKGPIQAGTTATGVITRQAITPNIKANTAANFDLVPLENKEFYAGFLAQLELPAINLLVNAGLARELVLHSIVKAARVTHADGTVYLFENDPTNDSWYGTNSMRSLEECANLVASNSYHPPFSHSVWLGLHANDCMYQKFLYFLHAALAYGMTTETRLVGNPAAAGDKNQVRRTERVVLCYDPAIARAYGKKVSPLGACGSKTLATGRRVYADMGSKVTLIQPVLRSPYSVFQYYGRLLATQSVSRVVLKDAHTYRLPTGDNFILNVQRRRGDCFASAQHDGVDYCVPKTNSENTKEIFVLLNVLVNLSTTRSSLPVTTTVQLAP